MLEAASISVSGLTPSIAKCHGERRAPVLFQMDSREGRKLDCSSEVLQGGVVGPALLCTPLLPVPQRVRE